MLTRRQFSAAPFALALQAQPAPPRKRRSESWFGLHFDLHPNEKDTALGRDVTEALIDKLLTTAKPDFVQYDSKGHPGWLGWPNSTPGPSAPGIVKDSLELWRKVTARRGVALYIHFSGVWDSEAVRRHPEWARLTPDGQPDKNQTSTFSPYVDQLMLPQLREAASRYQLDGAWIDGECWATNPDYSEAAVKAFGKPVPKSAKDPLWLEWLEFNREQFRRYVHHYLDELHSSHPTFQVASNWLYSTLVPEQPSLPVDFLSGDYLGNAPISTARLEARYLAQSGRPWDLMAWGFQQASSNGIGHIHKPAAQLIQESSVVLAQSGGFQIYYVPSRAGYFEDAHIQTMAKVGQHCRALQKFSQSTETVPQIAVLFSRESLYATSNKLFGGWGKLADPARGWLDLVLACGWSADVLPDWKLGSAASYPYVILPDWLSISEATRDALLDYTRNGGRLLVSGAANSRLFAAAAGIEPRGEATHQDAYVQGEVLGNVTGLWLDIAPNKAKVLAQRFPVYDTRSAGLPAAVSAPLGKGELCLLPGPIGSVYAQTHAASVRRFAASLIQLRFDPLVRLSAPPTVELVLRRKDNQLLIHLLNATAMQVAGDYSTVDFVPPVGPIRVNLGRTRPKSVTLQPDNTPLTPTLIQNNWSVEIPLLRYHSVLAVLS